MATASMIALNKIVVMNSFTTALRINYIYFMGKMTN